MNPINTSNTAGPSRVTETATDERMGQRPSRQPSGALPAGASNPARHAPFYRHGTRNFFLAQQLAYTAAMEVGTPGAPSGNPPARTVATLPDGAMVTTSYGAGKSLDSLEGFHILNASGKSLGKIETGVIDNKNEDCVALTWIDKGELKQQGAIAFAMWYLSKHTTKKHIEVRQILNPDLHAYLESMQPEPGAAEDSWRWHTDQVRAQTQAILVAKGWNLAE